MNDPTIIKFLNEDLRPLAEHARALKARARSALLRWENTLKAVAPDAEDVTPVDDARSDGVSRVQVAEIHELTKLLATCCDGIDDALIERFCVRALQAD